MRTALTIRNITPYTDAQESNGTCGTLKSWQDGGSRSAFLYRFSVDERRQAPAAKRHDGPATVGEVGADSDFDGLGGTGGSDSDTQTQGAEAYVTDDAARKCARREECPPGERAR